MSVPRSSSILDITNHNKEIDQTKERPMADTMTTKRNRRRRLTETIDAIKADPRAGAFTFRARSRWENGTHNIGEITTFTHAGSEDQSRTGPFVTAR
jgi:hypothetical protein